MSLRREIRLRDLILFHITAVVSVRWISLAAARGPSSLTLWALSFLLFFLPVAYAVIDFSRKYPQEGGIYQWTKHAFGSFHGFLCGWSYVASNLIYFPSLLSAVAGYAAYTIAGEDSALQANKWFVGVFSLAALWLALILNLIGLKIGKWVENIGGLSVWIPSLLLMVLGIYSFFAFGSQTEFSGDRLLPDLYHLETWSVFSNICFAFAGIELAGTMGEEIQNPEKNMPRSLYLAGAAITAIYFLGTFSILASLEENNINMITGIVQAIAAVFERFDLGILVPVIAGLLTMGGIGQTGAWLAGAARIPYAAGVDRYLPVAFGRVHPRWGTPYWSLLAQGIISSVILLMSFAGAGTVLEAYQFLVNSTLIVYFVPFLYLFASHFYVHYKSGTNKLALPTASLGFLAVVFSVILATLPPTDAANPVLYLFKVVGSSTILIFVSFFFYFRK